MNPEPISPAQCRAARAMLRWSIAALAEASMVGSSTIGSFEQERHTPTRANLAALRMALEAAGVRFASATEDRGPGVYLAKR